MPNPLRSEMIDCYELKESDAARWDSLAPFFLSEHWNSGAPGPAVQYKLALTPAHLLIEFSCTAALKHEPGRVGQFIKGLWEHDVGEVFIAGPGERYQEFNFSFDGAWWTEVFASCRMPSNDQPRTRGVSVSCDQTGPNKKVIALVEREALIVPAVGVQQLRAKVCAIIGSSPRHYYSASPLSSTAPDFHQSADFRPVRVAKQ